MLAFCIILGDTIPNVVAAMFPSLPGTPFLWLLTNRRAVIVICILGFSYPLSLYRDIAKVKIQPRLCLMCPANTVIVSEGVNVSIIEHDRKSSSQNVLRVTDLSKGDFIHDRNAGR